MPSTVLSYTMPVCISEPLGGDETLFGALSQADSSAVTAERIRSCRMTIAITFGALEGRSIFIMSMKLISYIQILSLKLHNCNSLYQTCKPAHLVQNTGNKKPADAGFLITSR